MLEKKLQIKPGQSIAIIGSPIQLELSAHSESSEQADVLLYFVRNQDELAQRTNDLSGAAQRSATLWLVYPKAKLLGTDLNRDTIREYVLKHGLDTIRQIAIDDTWSALRLKQK